MYIDKITGKVTSSPSFLTYEIKVPEGFSLSKTIVEQHGEKNKELNGKLLYNKPVSTDTVTYEKLGEMLTDEITDTLEYEDVQKLNDEDELLYYAQDHTETTNATVEGITYYELSGNTIKVYDDEENLISETPTYNKPIEGGFEEVEESEESYTINLEPVMIQVLTGRYLKDVMGDVTTTTHSFEETEESKIAIAWEDQEVPNMVMIDEEVNSLDDNGEPILDDEGMPVKVKTGYLIQVQNGTKTIQVESEWLEFEPIMIPNMVDVYITLEERPSEFTVEEVINAKYQSILEASVMDYVIADMFLNEDDMNLQDVNHSANTGVSLLQLLPNGQAKTKSIELVVPAKKFELLECEGIEGVDIYLEDNKFIDNKLELISPISSCTIKFVNTTDKSIEVKSYAIGY